jgi:hypothetical protein
MKNPKIVIRGLNTLGFICTPVTLVLAILWIFQPNRSYEPITVALGSLSAIFFGTSQIIQTKSKITVIKRKKSDDLDFGDLLNIVKDSNPTDWIVNINNDSEIAVFKSDPALRIETKFTNEFIHNNDFFEKWANKFPDPHATSQYYRLYYNSTRLEDFILVSVDGGRALLPLPMSQMNLCVKPIQYKVALLFDRFNSCEEYMKRAGLYVGE